MSYGEKIHPPTLRRRQRARAEGRVARSHDLATALVLLGGLCALSWKGRDVVDYLGQLTRSQLGGRVCLTVDAEVAIAWWDSTIYDAGRMLWPILSVFVVVAMVGHLGQGGWLFLPHKLAADLQRTNPFRGLDRIFSASSSIRWLWGLSKAAAVVAVAGWSLWAERQRWLQLGVLEIGPLAAFVCEFLFATGLKAAFALLALGALDYGYQRWRLERDLRMTTQELREELKGLHGVPLVIQRRRQLRRQLVPDQLPPA